MQTITVDLPETAYDVHVSAGSIEQLGGFLAPHTPGGRVALAIDRAIEGSHGARAIDALRSAGLDVVSFSILASEGRKSLRTVRLVYEQLLRANLDRETPLIAMGGGIVGDVVGFAAATYLRGVPFIQVPTTLLAMVDASVGGKTGVNIALPEVRENDESATTPEGSAKPMLGKNLIGAFWQPRAVLADPVVLSTLSERDYRCGLAECVKHGMLASTGHLTFIASNHDAILRRDPEVLETLISESVSIKARIVEADERESGQRALLNLGHTFAHAIESQQGFGLRHGEAVAIGLCAASSLAVATGRLRAEEAESIATLLRLLELPVRLPAGVDIDALMNAMYHDKKVRSGRLRLIVPNGIGKAEIAEDIETEAVRSAWRSVVDSRPSSQEVR